MLGAGILRGLVETGRNFLGSYFVPGRLTTVQYPEEHLRPKEEARTFPFLVYDGTDPAAGLRCTACTICEQECPAHCIYIVKDKNKKPDYLGKMQLHPASFDIDFSVCMGCGICAEVCPFDSIEMDTVYNLTTQNRLGDLMVHLEQLAKPNNYFHSIHPTKAGEINVQRAADKQKAEEKARAATAASVKPAAPAAVPAETTKVAS